MDNEQLLNQESLEKEVKELRERIGVLQSTIDNANKKYQDLIVLASKIETERDAIISLVERTVLAAMEGNK